MLNRTMALVMVLVILAFGSGRTGSFRYSAPKLRRPHTAERSAQCAAGTATGVREGSPFDPGLRGLGRRIAAGSGVGGAGRVSRYTPTESASRER